MIEAMDPRFLQESVRRQSVIWNQASYYELTINTRPAE